MYSKTFLSIAHLLFVSSGGKMTKKQPPQKEQPAKPTRKTEFRDDGAPPVTKQIPVPKAPTTPDSKPKK